jgi:hypothetical protein
MGRPQPNLRLGRVRSEIACRRLPAPLSLVLVTVNVAALVDTCRRNTVRTARMVCLKQVVEEMLKAGWQLVFVE